MQLQIAVSAQAEESATKLWEDLQDHDESYLHRAYNKGSVELFKQTVQRNRSFSK